MSNLLTPALMRLPPEIWHEILWQAMATAAPIARDATWLRLACVTRTFHTIICAISQTRAWVYLRDPTLSSTSGHPMFQASRLTVVISTTLGEQAATSQSVTTLFSDHGPGIEELVFEGDQRGWDLIQVQIPPSRLPNLRSLVIEKGIAAPQTLITNHLHLLHASVADGGLIDLGIHQCRHLTELHYAPNTLKTFLNDVPTLSHFSRLQKLKVLSCKEQWGMDWQATSEDSITATPPSLPLSLLSLHMPWELSSSLQHIPALPSLLEFGMGNGSSSIWGSMPRVCTDNITAFVNRCPTVKQLIIRDVRAPLELGLYTHWHKIVDLEVTAGLDEDWAQQRTFTHLLRLVVHAAALNVLPQISAPALVKFEIGGTSAPSAVALKPWLDQHRELNGLWIS
ncbi:hypothetical protein CYLTODRAFT_459458 [Cylindrobasidium torrendii FP15055 ss-10]|uniref:Uncharacterized protein n=1 Tax=Cylindrobasidium torrendii FP15055 ss-10 TaxID=1314674 RepID=A0A0D7AU50_9AGAR|nr:hypothetical protein CYLTODRAFT_459458 [Cylindrobasidium torrendii FP15055 ss-10]